MYIHAITSTLGCSTMKVEGRVNNKTLHLLIDSGGIHNFLDSIMTEKLGCETEVVPPLDVRVENGEEMACDRVCRRFKWYMQGHHFEANVYLVPLENYHIVLEVQWLATLEDILWIFER